MAALAMGLVRRFHECDKVLSNRHAQTQRAAAATVVKINHGFVATCMPSSTMRKICTSARRPKTIPVVTRYAFIGVGNYRLPRRRNMMQRMITAITMSSGSPKPSIATIGFGRLTRFFA